MHLILPALTETTTRQQSMKLSLCFILIFFQLIAAASVLVMAQTRGARDYGQVLPANTPLETPNGGGSNSGLDKKKSGGDGSGINNKKHNREQSRSNKENDDGKNKKRKNKRN